MEKLSNPGVITPGIVLTRQLARQHEQFYSDAEIQIRDHQKEAMDALKRYLSKGGSEGHVEMATASGKSLLIAYLAQAAADLGMRTLVLAPTINIARQLYGQDGTKGIGRFTDLHEKEKVSMHHGGSNGDLSFRKPVLVTTYGSLISLTKSDKLPAVDLILADEAHRSLGTVTSGILKEYSPNAIKVGFTATPEYNPDRTVGEVYPDAIYSLDLKESVERGLTPPIRSLIYETNVEIPSLDQAHADFTERELERLITLKQRNEKVVQFATDFVKAGMQGIVKCVPGGNLAHAQLLADQLSNQEIQDKDGVKRNIVAMSVGAHRSTDENAAIIAAFDKGYIDVMTFVYALNEGFDSNNVQFGINASPTTSLVNEGQFLGRMLRGEDEVVVVDFLDRAKKRQITSLHVLGLERYTANATVGGAQRNAPKNTKNNMESILNSALYKEIMQSDGKMLTDFYTRETESYEDYQVRKWEDILSKQGLPAELPNYFKVKALAVEAVRQARDALGADISVEQAIDYIDLHQLMGDKIRHGMLEHDVTAVFVEEHPSASIEDITVGDVTSFMGERAYRYKKVREFAARKLLGMVSDVDLYDFFEAGGDYLPASVTRSILEETGKKDPKVTIRYAKNALHRLIESPRPDEFIDFEQIQREWYENPILAEVPKEVYFDKTISRRLAVKRDGEHQVYMSLNDSGRAKWQDVTIPVAEYLVLKHEHGQYSEGASFRWGATVHEMQEDLNNYELRLDIAKQALKYERQRWADKRFTPVNDSALIDLTGDVLYLEAYLKQLALRIDRKENPQKYEEEKRRYWAAQGIGLIDVENDEV